MENPPTPDRPPESNPEPKNKGPATENILDPSQSPSRSQQPLSDPSPTIQVETQQEQQQASGPSQAEKTGQAFSSTSLPPIPEFPGQSPYLTADMARHISQSSSSGRSGQYQLVSPGTPSDPRAMSQVSPGFIFVNFLSLLRCCFSPAFPSLSYVSLSFILLSLHWLLCTTSVCHFFIPKSPRTLSIRGRPTDSRHRTIRTS